MTSTRPTSLRVLVTGSTGFIGARIIDALADAGHRPVGCARTEKIGRHVAAPFVAMDLAQPLSISRVLDEVRPDAIIHAAAERDMPACEREPSRARVVNLDATRGIAHWCAANTAPLLFLSTDQVFDGVHGGYREEDPRNPVNVYGTTKALAEDAVLAHANTTIARVALTLGHSIERTRSPNEFIANKLRDGQRVPMFANEIRTPVLAHDVAIALTDLLAMPSRPRIIHLAGPDTVSRLEMGVTIARAYHLDETMLDASKYVAPPQGLRRAENTALNTDLAQRTLPRPPRGMAAMAAFLAATEPK